MKKDAHYYAILACSRAAGLNEEISAIIAYASQFVDDARIDHLIPQKMPDVNRYDWIDGEKCFHGMASCHCYFKVKTFNYNSMINKTAAFHFVPGCKGPTFVRKMRCREDSPLSNQLVKNAIETKNPYKLGITLHAYADTFSHQGFSALMSKVNDVKKVKIHSLYYKVLPFKLVLIFQSLLRKSFDNHFDKFVPPYGHGQVLSYPDLPFLKWSYFYDYSDRFSDKYKYSGKINNPKRYQRAFIKIYNYLKEFAEKCPEYCDNSISLNLRDILHLLVVKKGNIARYHLWRVFINKNKLLDHYNEYQIYDSSLWIKIAFNEFTTKQYNREKVTDAIPAKNFADSHWYNFYKAVKWYKNQFLREAANQGVLINI